MAKGKNKVLETKPSVTQLLQHLELAVLNLVDHPLKTETISIDRGMKPIFPIYCHYHDLTL
jgi:hypothetical protein